MRQSGILLHLTSLPGPEGIGTMGKAAYQFIDFLADSGFSIWQMLPIGPTGYGDSPYQSPSAFAGNPLLIDLDTLAAEGLLDKALLKTHAPAAQVDFEAVKAEKEALLHAAFNKGYEALKAKVSAFAAQNPWAAQYAGYQALADTYGPFGEWPVKARVYHLRPDAEVSALLEQKKPLISYYLFVQYLFDVQFKKLKQYANARGILLFGDMPIYAAPGSADVWANPSIFQMDETLLPTRVAGVPPDYFSADGQLWGNPLYNWKALRKDHFTWWIARLKSMGERFDIVRVDHFIGFANYYSIPASAKTAREGKWVKNRGKAFFKVVKRELPNLTVIAEDLGEVNKRVRRLISYCGYPGMKILVFAFDGGADNQHLPQNVPEHSVVYTGTHDNDTVLGWWRRVDEKERENARQYLALKDDQEIADTLVRAALSCRAERAVVPMQDILGLDNSARMNTPGTVGGQNWRYRMLPGCLTEELQLRLKALNHQSQRGN